MAIKGHHFLFVSQMLCKEKTRGVFQQFGIFHALFFQPPLWRALNAAAANIQNKICECSQKRRRRLGSEIVGNYADIIHVYYAVIVEV